MIANTYKTVLNNIFVPKDLFTNKFLRNIVSTLPKNKPVIKAVMGVTDIASRKLYGFPVDG